MKMYVVLNGKRNGPHEPEDVKELLDAGKISGESLAWKSGLAEWKPLGDLFPEWMEDAETPPEASSSQSREESEESSTSEEVENAENQSDGDRLQKNEAPVKEVEGDPEDTAVSEPDPPADAPAPAPQAPTPPPDDLHLIVDGEEQGPLIPEKTMALCVSGKANANDLAWKQGMKTWKPLKELWPDCAKIQQADKPVEQASSDSLSERLRNALRNK